MSVSFISNTYTYPVGPSETFSDVFDISTALDYSILVKFVGTFSAHIALYVSADGGVSVLDRAIDLASGSSSILPQKYFSQSAYLGFYGGPGTLTVTFLKQI